VTRRHIIITGTGRAGTTLLVQLLTVLGLDTGFSDVTADVDPNCNAGMEWDLRNPNAPYIVKSPWMCDYLDDLLDQGEVTIDHAIIPVRDLYQAAESRREVTRRNAAVDAPGGLWHTNSPDEQEMILLEQLYKIIHTIAKRDIPLTLLHFPRLINDPEYLFRKLKFLFETIDYSLFVSQFQTVVRPELAHDFRREATRT
jgi:hypothetical protein